MADFALALKRYREENVLTQEDVARHLGVAVGTVRNWERGVAPRGLYAERLKELLGIEEEKGGR